MPLGRVLTSKCCCAAAVIQTEDFKLKGFDIAAKAFACIELREPSYLLIFVGALKGKKQEMKGKLLEFGIREDQLFVKEFVESREEMKKLLCEVDLVIMPSRAEGFGLVALEALSAGLPVLVGKNSGLAQAIRDLPNGKNYALLIQRNLRNGRLQSQLFNKGITNTYRR